MSAIERTGSAASAAHNGQQAAHRQQLSTTLRAEQGHTVSTPWEWEGPSTCMATSVACPLGGMLEECNLKRY